MKLKHAFCILIAIQMPLLAGTNLVLRLDGGYVEVPDSDELSVTDNFTLEAWAANYADDWEMPRTIISKGRPSGGSAFNFLIYEGTFRFGLNDGAGINIAVTADQAIARSKWYHFAATYDGTTMKAFVDGVLRGSYTITLRLQNSTLPLLIGREPINETMREFMGLVDEVRVWNRALAQQEIAARMNATLTGNEPDLAAYWTFDDGTARDLSPNGNDGTLLDQSSIVPDELALLRIVYAVEILLGRAPVGATYQIQWATNVQSPEWFDLGSPVVSTGEEIGVLDSLRHDPARIYRAVILP